MKRHIRGVSKVRPVQTSAPEPQGIPDYITKLFQEYKFFESVDWQFMPWITCADGYYLSIQASLHHNCSPRVNDLDDYDTYEICIEAGFVIPTLIDSSGPKVYPDRMPYGHVAHDTVNVLLHLHGGPDKVTYYNPSDGTCRVKKVPKWLRDGK